MQNLNITVIINTYEDWVDVLSHTDTLHIGGRDEMREDFIELKHADTYWYRFLLESLVMNNEDLRYIYTTKYSPNKDSNALLISDIGFDPEYLAGMRDNQDVDWYL